ncbi:hypothetical protein VTK73DRAFT_5184 [Phialemonium thermophilum]|uniref:Uncharacterized protein n=1 Tax=Phialemonium thermophilum TaxID=223376 RepID=A0ABR3V316_9PEZI
MPAIVHPAGVGVVGSSRWLITGVMATTADRGRTTDEKKGLRRGRRRSETRTCEERRALAAGRPSWSTSPVRIRTTSKEQPALCVPVSSRVLPCSLCPLSFPTTRCVGDSCEAVLFVDRGNLAASSRVGLREDRKIGRKRKRAESQRGKAKQR